MASNERRTNGKSAITNGVKLLHDVAKNSRDGRRYRDLYQQYMQDYGGELPELCKQAACLVVQRERMDADVLNGKTIDQFHFVRIANSLNRTLRVLKQLSKQPNASGARKRRAREEALLT